MYYNKKFKEAFNHLNITQDSFVKIFNIFYQDKDEKYLTQPKLSKILNGQIDVPMVLVVFLVEYYYFNINFFIGKSEDMFTTYKKSKSFFNFKLYNK